MAEPALRRPIVALCEPLRRRCVFADRVEAMCEALRAPVPLGLDGAGVSAGLGRRCRSAGWSGRARWRDALGR